MKSKKLTKEESIFALIFAIAMSYLWYIGAEEFIIAFISMGIWILLTINQK